MPGASCSQDDANDCTLCERRRELFPRLTLLALLWWFPLVQVHEASFRGQPAFGVRLSREGVIRQMPILVGTDVGRLESP